MESVRGFLAELSKGIDELDIVSVLRKEAAEAELVRQKLRRTVIDRISLRDQPILDRYQGEIFRMPLDRRLVLLGPPGTGKTTTLIRRLAQKRLPEALSEEEAQLLSMSGLHEAFAGTYSWAMFSPTELLSLYLRDAFNREGVAAVDEVNLRTWSRERVELARNVLGILRSADRGVFQLDETADIIADGSSSGLRDLFDEFFGFVEDTVLEETAAAMRQLEDEAGDRDVASSVRQVRRALGGHNPRAVRDLVRLIDAGPEILQPEIRRLDESITAELNRSANRLLSQNKGLLEELVDALPTLISDERPIQEDEEDEDEYEDEGETLPPTRITRVQALDTLLSAIRSRARAAALGRSRVRGRAGRLLEFLGDRLPTAEETSNLGSLLLRRARVRAIRHAPRRSVMGVPRLYATFRREAVRDGRLFRSESSESVKQAHISPSETDVLILVMLRNARRLAEQPSSISPDWLELITSRYLMQVFVDEATDFSAVQLACTIELAHPRLRSWFACGDFLQRITRHGVQDASDFRWLAPDGPAVELREVRIGYRQTRRLRDLAATLAGPEADHAEEPVDQEDMDAWPLLAENHSGAMLGEWLANRVLEVERAIGRLPSIAVFVDGDARIDGIVAATRPWLDRRNVRIVGCKDGRVVGDAREVRVFDVQHVKGLEFEAVFFVGIDQLAERLPDLFDRYLYVGITRAATYLGVTSEGLLPTRLEFARHHFADATTHAW
jgi:hypothetical protein